MHACLCSWPILHATIKHEGAQTFFCVMFMLCGSGNPDLWSSPGRAFAAWSAGIVVHWQQVLNGCAPAADAFEEGQCTCHMSLSQQKRTSGMGPAAYTAGLDALGVPNGYNAMLDATRAWMS